MVVKTKGKAKETNNNVVFGIIGVAVVATIVIILLNASGITNSNVTVNYDLIPVTQNEDGSFVGGNPEAPVTIVVWEDFRCSHCHDYEPTLKQFLKEYVETGLARFEFRMLQTASPDTQLFSLAECTGEIDPTKYFIGRDILFDMTSRGWSSSSPREYAQRVGIPYEQILECAGDSNQLNVDTALAQQLGVGGTPAVAVRYADGSLQRLTELPTMDRFRDLVATGSIIQ
jgi:protein-disulfide isomerase